MNLRIHTKFTISQVLLISIPLLFIGVFFFVELNDMIIADTIRSEQSAASETGPLLVDFTDDVYETSMDILDSDFYKNLLSLETTDELNRLIPSTHASNLQDTIQSILEMDAVTNVKIYTDLSTARGVSLSPLNDVLTPYGEAQGSYWHGIFQGSPQTRDLFCPTFYLSPDEAKNYGDIAYIIKSSSNLLSSSTPTFLAIYFDSDTLEYLLENNLTSDTNVAYIINSRDSIVATSNTALSSTYYFNYETVQNNFMTSNNFITKQILGEDVYAVFYSIAHTDWYMVVAMPSGPLLEQSQTIIMTFVLVFLVFVLLSFLIAHQLSRSITTRLSSVIDQMGLARLGPPVALDASDTMDEVGELIDTYNYMTRVINQLITDQAKASEDLRVAEFNSLQAQINPHFLYNTMDMINWLSQEGRTEEVSAAIQNLSRFYKLTLSKKNSINTIAEELEHVTIYIELQNMRFENQIDFIVDIPDSLLDYNIPKLSFQPVAENAILHGIMETEAKSGTIVISGWLEDDSIVILISDDGAGIPPEKLALLLSGTTHASPKGNGSNIAIYNTHQRLQVLYGIEYGLSYSSTLGEGTDVEIRIPAQTPMRTGEI